MNNTLAIPPQAIFYGAHLLGNVVRIYPWQSTASFVAHRRMQHIFNHLF